MSHMRPRQGWPARPAWQAMVLAIAMLLVGAVGAHATTVNYSGDNTTLIVTGVDNVDHDIQFRLSANQTADEILDTAGFTSIPADCTVVNSNTWISCPGHLNVKVDLGGGDDDVTFASQGFDCFNAYSLNLGDGANTLNLSDDCGATLAGLATVSSGSGPDVLTAGSQGPITFNAGGGDDSVYAGPGDDFLHGGEGADRLFGYEGSDQVLGEGGADSPNGGAGNDLVDGGTGDDALELCSGCIGSGNDTGAGADTYTGGPGSDRLWLDGHPGGMAISIDGQANDGTSGEGDNVGSDIEAIVGTVVDDVFTGGPGAETFEGNGGNDTIHGAGGDDLLQGDGGDDQIFGDGGNDKVEGSYGTDTVDGGAGTDQLYGDVAGCSVFCEPDIDFLLARDGERDIVNCGGPGSARVDQLDVVAFCASVDRETVAVAGGGGAGGSPAKASFAGSKRSVKVSRNGRFSYSFRSGAGLRGKAVFRSANKVRTSRRARVTLASKSFKAPSSRKVTLKIKLSRKSLAILRRNRKIKTKVTVTLKNAAGLSSVASTTVMLKR
jgi:Ca2+-binding RTX toxin-like protein